MPMPTAVEPGRPDHVLVFQDLLRQSHGLRGTVELARAGEPTRGWSWRPGTRWFMMVVNDEVNKLVNH